MSRCGKCRGQNCSCQLVGDSTTSVFGLGASYEPFQVRPATPAFRYVGTAHRTSNMTFTLNTDTVIPFQATELPITGGNMWNVSQPTRLTAAVSGLYLVGGFAAQAAVGGGVGQTWSVWIAKNGAVATAQVRRSVTSQTSAKFLSSEVMTLIRLTAGDYIELYARSNRTALTPGTFISGEMNGIKTWPYFWAQWMDE